MIIKVLSRKTSTGTLMNYLFKYITNEDKTTTKSFVVRHNVRANTIQGYTQEFEANEKIRIHKRKQQPAVYHTIISWHTNDAKFLDDKKLRILAKEFIKQRGEQNLYVITKHTDTDRIHLHCAISATQLNGKSSRISKQEFEQLKINMDRFQREHFSELSHSLPQHGKQLEERKLWATMQKGLQQLEQLRAVNDKELELEFERTLDLSFGY